MHTYSRKRLLNPFTPFKEMMMKTRIQSLAVAGIATGLLAGSANAATITHDSTTLISNDSNFDVSVYDGKAGYANFDDTLTGTFGDGTVEAYAFAKNTLIPPTSGYSDNEIGFYATGGSSITIDSYDGATTFADFDRGDVWTTNDPDSQSANYGGSTETISGGHDVIGTIDISNYVSGKVYILAGSFDNPFDVSLTFNGGTTTFAPTVDPAGTRNIYVVAFSFDDAAKEHTSIEYNYDSRAQNRARFMGVVVDGVVPEPGSLALLGLGGLLIGARRRRD